MVVKNKLKVSNVIVVIVSNILLAEFWWNCTGKSFFARILIIALEFLKPYCWKVFKREKGNYWHNILSKNIRILTFTSMVEMIELLSIHNLSFRKYLEAFNYFFFWNYLAQKQSPYYPYWVCLYILWIIFNSHSLKSYT